ncbi:MAG: hypothetical protein E7586_01115 [Ruminococcaceae bacterium]|nr:hypothetical protein [Oscillospiraceae bacterium]
MKSILNSVEINYNAEAINFIVASKGSVKETHELIEFLGDKYSKFIEDNSANIYNVEKVSRAENNLKYFNRKTKFSLIPDKRDMSKKYIGVFDANNKERLHELLFSSLPRVRPHHFKEFTYYSKNNLLEVLKQEAVKSNEIIFDFEISCFCIPTLDNDVCSYVTFSLNRDCIETDDELNSVLLWFKSIINELDLQFYNIFKSAYISVGDTINPIEHLKLYCNFDHEDIDNYIMGTEWLVYISKSISERIQKSQIDELSKIAHVENLNNGIVYCYNSDIKDCNNNIRAKLNEILEPIVMPAYNIHWWNFICEYGVPHVPKCILVHRNRLDTLNHELVFSYNIDYEKIYQRCCSAKEDLIEIIRFKNYI